ncbi:MAG: hypothetical protein ACR2I2_22875 [Bryobacteraceae bacterium]
MKHLGLISLIAAFAGTVAARPIVVVGRGDPNLDVPAVQAAVDQGGRVVLRGHFSFDRPPTAPAGAIYSRMVTVSKNVVISGSRDENGDMPTMEGGERPFLVDAVDAHVTIQGLRFVRPRAGAIWVYAVGGLAVTGCRIESIEATAEFGTEGGQANPVSGAIFVGANPHPPNATFPGKPENFSGTLSILDNDIDVGGMPGTQTLGVVMFAVGRSPDKEVEVYVSGNNIRNVTEPAINLRVIGGRAHAERNVIVTGGVTFGAADAIRVVGSGSYLIAHNSIDCGWTDLASVGIDVFGQPSPSTPEASAIVVDNDVTMSASEGTAFGPNSAAIEIKGFAQGNSVLSNRIRGRARAALAVIDQNGRMPGNSSFVANNLDGFQSSLADIFVDAGVANTFVIGRQATVEDHGSGTVLIPTP